MHWAIFTAVVWPVYGSWENLVVPEVGCMFAVYLFPISALIVRRKILL